MRITLLTVFPELFDSFLHTSLIARAQEKGIFSCQAVSYFSYVKSKERIDAPTFGPGAGMLLRPEVVAQAIDDQEHKNGKAFKVFFSPQGKKLNQQVLQQLADKIQEQKHLMLVSSRYEGMDTRVEQAYADEIVSVGDFVVMSGDVPTMLLLEGITRLLPGVVGKKESIEAESFMGPFLDYPQYTEPVEWHGMKVPDIIRSGNHAAIAQWREEQAAQKSVHHHFQWVRTSIMDEQQKKLAASFTPPHYAALMHTDVLLPNDKVGTTSVTSLDIHDIARSAKTYGIASYFIVQPLVDQQKIVHRLLHFWLTDVGINYNKQRHEAIKLVTIAENLSSVINAIEKHEEKKPIIIATSACKAKTDKSITYFDQEKVWALNRPILFLFGTGRGLSSNLIQDANFVLDPLEGFTDFNHLSVRSAVGIVFDRWLGINVK